MPQAPSWDELYKFEDAVEWAAQSILEAHGVSAFIQRSESIIATPCVGVQFTVGPAMDRYGKRVEDGQLFIDTWTGKLTFAIFTARTKGNQYHSGIRARIRWLMNTIAFWNADVLPFHQMLRILEDGTSVQITPDKDRDVSEISFAVHLNIREDAWPLVAADSAL